MFQIDLDLAMINYGISMDWDGKSERQNWMQQGESTPCACEKCYFCLNGFTTGIAHKRKMEATVVYRCTKRVKTEECNEDRVNLQQRSKYCKICYRKQDTPLKAPVHKRKCNTSRMGCVQCKETICKSCWTEGYDEHAK